MQSISVRGFTIRINCNFFNVFYWS